MAETKSDAGQPQELQPKTQKQMILQRLGALSQATIDNINLFFDSKQYPPNVVGLINKWSAVDAIPTRIISFYFHQLDRAKQNELGKELGDTVNKRIPFVGEAIESLIPDIEKMAPREQRGFVYPQDKVDEIFNQEEAKYKVRVIDFLLDPEISQWWMLITDNEFEKFINSVKDRSLPTCLVSQEEMVRLWDLQRENFTYEWKQMTNLYRASHPESATDFEDVSPTESQSQGTEANAARYTFLDLYQKYGDLDTTLKEVANLYPNEKTL